MSMGQRLAKGEKQKNETERCSSQMDEFVDPLQ